MMDASRSSSPSDFENQMFNSLSNGFSAPSRVAVASEDAAESLKEMREKVVETCVRINSKLDDGGVEVTETLLDSIMARLRGALPTGLVSATLLVVGAVATLMISSMLVSYHQSQTDRILDLDAFKLRVQSTSKWAMALRLGLAAGGLVLGAALLGKVVDFFRSSRFWKWISGESKEEERVATVYKEAMASSEVSEFLTQGAPGLAGFAAVALALTTAVLLREPLGFSEVMAKVSKVSYVQRGFSTIADALGFVIDYLPSCVGRFFVSYVQNLDQLPPRDREVVKDALGLYRVIGCEGKVPDVATAETLIKTFPIYDEVLTKMRVGGKTSRALQSFLNEVRNSLAKNMVAATAITNSGCCRPVPVGLYIHGLSRIGKSYLAASLGKILFPEQTDGSNGYRNPVYQRNASEKFSSGYAGQPIFSVDELLSTTDD